MISSNTQSFEELRHLTFFFHRDILQTNKKFMYQVYDAKVGIHKKSRIIPTQIEKKTYIYSQSTNIG